MEWTAHRASIFASIWRRTSLVVKPLCLIAVCALTFDAAAASDDPTQPAIPAIDFLQSLGIGIHYAQGVSAQSYVQPLRYLGVKAIRDDLGQPEGYVFLNRETGVKVDLIASSRDLAATLDRFRRLARQDALLAIEGPNEPNNFKITYRGKIGGGYPASPNDSVDWTPVAEFQRDLYAAVKADDVLSQYPVFHTSEAGAEIPNVGLQFLIIPQSSGTTFPVGTKFADYANVHNYVSGTEKKYVDNQAWKAADPTLNEAWDSLYVEYGRLWRGGYTGYSNEQLVTLPRVTTETGWGSELSAGGERRQGTVLLNTYLSQFKRGWRYTFIYMVRDGEGGGGTQGVFHADSTPKLAAHYIHNLTSLLVNSKPIATPRSLNYLLEPRPVTMHDLLLQVDDNRVALIVWSERTAGEDNISLTLPAGAASVAIYDPTTGIEPISKPASMQKMSFSVSDHPLIIMMDLRS